MRILTRTRLEIRIKAQVKDQKLVEIELYNKLLLLLDEITLALLLTLLLTK